MAGTVASGQRSAMLAGPALPLSNSPFVLHVHACLPFFPSSMQPFLYHPVLKDSAAQELKGHYPAEPTMSCMLAWRKRQTGAVSIEFAAMFVIVFMLFYGIVGYVIPLMLLSSYNEISAEAVRAATLIPENQERVEYEQQVKEIVDAVISDSWLGKRNDSWKEVCSGKAGYVTLSGNQISVCIAHNNPEQIIPPITLFSWKFPQLPPALIGEATIQLR